MPSTTKDKEPTLQEAQQELSSRFEEQCTQAAKALSDADIVLLVTGAGWGADSGLAVFGDIAKVTAYEERGLAYDDMSQPRLVDEDPELFYGFWGQCFNDYRSTRPHEGYDIIQQWRNEKNSVSEVATKIRTLIQEKEDERKPFDNEETQRLTPYDVKGEPAGAFYAFTSNVDAHFYDKLEAAEIHDCHGSIELWQCSDRDCQSGIWRAPVDHKFVVDHETMLASYDLLAKKKKEVNPDGKSKSDEHNRPNDDTVAAVGHTRGQGQRTNALKYMPEAIDKQGWYLEESTNWPKCGHCKSNLARPAIFMFGDMGWKYDHSQYIRWLLWKEAVTELICQNDDYKICIVEVGCGVKIATLRNLSEQMLEELITEGGDATLVRINPEFPLVSHNVEDVAAKSTIPIMSTGLRAVKRINEIYNEMR